MIEWIWKLASAHALLAKTVAGIGFPRQGTYLTTTGWYRSFKERVPIDASGCPIPWYSYPAIDFVSRRVQSNWMVFEYGCGNSTRWWSSRVAQVTACEHCAEWHERIVNNLPANAECVLKTAADYAAYIQSFSNAFDVIVIDGIDRVACALHCVPALKEGGIVIFDNSDREEYQAGYDYLTEQGFKRLDFVGLGPIVMISTATAIFYRPNNCLGL